MKDAKFMFVARKRWKQLELRARTWGGKRERAGRPKKDGAGVSHLARPAIRKNTPVHVTVRFRPEVGSVRKRKLIDAMRGAFRGGCTKDGFRICQFSIQRNHMHLACEADSAEALSSGVAGFEIRVARRLNRRLGRKGRVFADRFHAVPMRSPRQVRNALCYILQNARRHGEKLDASWGGIDPFSSAWHFDGWKDERWRRGLSPPREEPCVAPAQGWLLREGWQKWGRIGVTEVPPAARKLFASREAWLGMAD
jgi:REP element-mobilizing transposase RayT